MIKYLIFICLLSSRITANCQSNNAQIKANQNITYLQNMITMYGGDNLALNESQKLQLEAVLFQKASELEKYIDNENISSKKTIDPTIRRKIDLKYSNKIENILSHNQKIIFRKYIKRVAIPI